MKKYIQYTLWINICIITFFSFVSADTQGDCTAYLTYTEDEYAKIVGEQFPNLSVFTKQDIKTAVRHIQQFCCYGGKSLVSDEKCRKMNVSSSPEYYAYSPFIIDHLWNIGMRKLDGIEEHCNVLNISCIGANESRVALKRREKIQKIAEDREGHPPSEIMELFIEVRGDAAGLVDDKKKYEKTGNYKKLRNIYEQMCVESVDIWKAFSSLAPSNTESGKGNVLTGMENICKNMVQERYLQEVNYIRTLMVEHGIHYVVNNLKNYLLKYFVENRFKQLSQKYSTLEGCFTTVLRKTTRTPCCNE